MAIVYHANDAKAQDVVGRIEAAGGTTKAVKVDVSIASESRRMVSEVIADFGRIDILVNNAGRLAWTRRRKQSGTTP